MTLSGKRGSPPDTNRASRAPEPIPTPLSDAPYPGMELTLKVRVLYVMPGSVRLQTATGDLIVTTEARLRELGLLGPAPANP
jgi:hypothetical protein